ncbi:putative sulfate exporter family transporter [Phytohabitans sp. ZYX-F-186]|uniref:Sulfate exporter family transporter n=1 Tax=Phytohabitans maris TaxID=3071409 RepID=A0ABU0ZLW8_9ACTN|nr:putative sulfate exporter family transporter [Phytohabitans sp. ZYX-F-186]MDQ7908037.1 putative sulfate exporter family transporter [Phytohabitans sp. ZYX-F-186]
MSLRERTAVAYRVRSTAPGLLVAAGAAAAGYAVNRLASPASPMVVAIGLGILLRAAGGYHERLRAGLGIASRALLRTGVVLLGLQLALADIRRLGLGTAAVVLAGVAACFVATRWFGLRLGLSPARALLVATGVSICGASAVAAMNQVADGDEEDTVTAVAVVTVLGTLCLALMPLLGLLLGLDETTLGLWTGASVHEVGQVVAIGGMAGTAALSAAVLVKLSRVALLAPLVATVTLARRRGTGETGPRPPILPWFVAGFVVMAALRTSGLVPDPVRHAAATTSSLLLAMAMFALGTAVDLRGLAQRGGRALVAGALGTALLAGLSLAGLTLTN